MELEALFDAVIVKPFEAEETTYGNIIVPDLGKEKNEMGTVMAVGPGKPTITGDFIPTKLKVGDKVVLPTMGFTKIEHKGDEYLIGSENQILAEVIQEVNVDKEEEAYINDIKLEDNE